MNIKFDLDQLCNQCDSHYTTFSFRLKTETLEWNSISTEDICSELQTSKAICKDCVNNNHTIAQERTKERLSGQGFQSIPVTSVVFE